MKNQRKRKLLSRGIAVRHPIRWVLVLLALYACACAVCIGAANGRLVTYVDYGPRAEGLPEMQVDGNAVEIRDLERCPDGTLRVTAEGKRAGRTYVELNYPGESYSNSMLVFQTGPLNMTFERSSLNFSGCQAVLVCTEVMLALFALILLMHFFWRRRNAFYSYRTAFSAGIAIYVAVNALLFARSARSFWSPSPTRQMYVVLGELARSSSRFMIVTAPILLLICLGLFASNLALVRHEGLRPRNLLAALAALAVIGGFFVQIAVDNAFTSGSFQEYRRHACLTSAVSTCFVFMEAMLLGTMLCGLIAARSEPDYDRDFVIIHGCQIARDGGPTPLLRGRIDRALAFAARQKAQTGRDLIFIPSGGQGADERVSEAECIAAYLKARGVPGDRMRLETKSTSTLENMRFSKTLIDAMDPDARVAFSTTNYHVFRSGILGREAGLDAQGMGSPTRWYFWPNAFIREFVGLIVAERRALLILLIEMLAIFTALTYFIIA